MKLTQSAILSFLSCPRKYCLRYVRKLVPDVPEPPHLRLGTAFHKALELHYQGESHEDALAGAKIMALPMTERTLARAMLEGYWKKYPTEPFEVYSQERVFYAEHHTPEGKINLCGKLDGEIRKDGTKALFEHKTAAVVGSNYLAKLSIDFQCLFYLCFSGIGTERCLYNVIEKAQLRQKKTETLKEFRQRLGEEYLNNPARYTRLWLYFSNTQQKQFVNEVTLIAEQIQRAHNREELFYRNRGHCYPWMGKPCEYESLCFDPQNERKMQQFIEREPFQELEEEEDVT